MLSIKRVVVAELVIMPSHKAICISRFREWVLWNCLKSLGDAWSVAV
jgi:hypothetical protein